MIAVEQLADALLPGVRPYIVRESDDPPQSIRIPGAHGVTGRTLDLVLFDWLQARSNWRGRAPAIFVADNAIRQWAANESRGDAMQFDRIHEQLMAAVFVHECAHVAEAGIDLSPPTARKQALAATIAAYSVAITGNSPWPPFFGHSAHFIRNAIHLAHRAETIGHSFPIDMLFCGENYQIAEPSEFAHALDDEPNCLAREPIFEICTYRPRMNFIRLWQSCVHRWINQQPSGTLAVTAAIELLGVTHEV